MSDNANFEAVKNNGSYKIAYNRGGKLEMYAPPEIYPFEWQGLEFFVYPNPYYVLKTDIPFKATEKQTGMCIANGATPIATANKAVALLDKKGLEKIKAGIEKGLALVAELQRKNNSSC